jgi:hypothetical protein
MQCAKRACLLSALLSSMCWFAPNKPAGEGPRLRHSDELSLGAYRAPWHVLMDRAGANAVGIDLSAGS